ncbi:hypothetical protein [Pyrofollis japonicus]|uniref:hypothetical protein n=1 Tax=Pyrofollis japonicus TaxID=3060460 RepID=UPI00295B5469|nr:hypothetical protein [Pyrofollis japonicus]
MSKGRGARCKPNILDPLLVFPVGRRMHAHVFVAISNGFVSLLLLLLGLVLVFAGLELVRIVAGLVLGVVLALVFYAIGSGLGLLAALVLGFVGFIIGAVIGFALFKAGIALIGGLVLADILVKLFAPGAASGLAVLVLGIVLAAVFYVVVDYFVVAATVAAGSLLVYAGLLYWVPSILAAIVSLLLFAAGIVYGWGKMRGGRR